MKVSVLATVFPGGSLSRIWYLAHARECRLRTMSSSGRLSCDLISSYVNDLEWLKSSSTAAW
eukprot:scaffold8020_cov390-Prasinococcus_capsulatus_cf.AAC.2